MSESAEDPTKLASNTLIRLEMAPRQDSSSYKDFDLAKEFLVDATPAFVITLSRWNTLAGKRKSRLDYARRYLAANINKLLTTIHPAVTPQGKPSFTIAEPINAMYLQVYDEFVGASVIGICRNPNCPVRFFLKKKGKGKRAPRSDRQYCGRNACQRYGYDHLGLVRSAKKK